MAVTKLDYLGTGRGMKQTTPNDYEGSTHWRAHSNTDAAGPFSVLLNSQAMGAPRPGDPYIDGSLIISAIRCKDVKIAEQDSEFGQLWLIDANYSSKLDETQTDPNPLNRDPVIRWGARQSQEVVWFGDRLDGLDPSLSYPVLDSPVMNSAGERFDPPLTRDFSRP